MKNSTIIKTGAVGLVLAAICCFTPVLVILLGVLELSAWLGWIDYVLLLVLALFLGLTVYGLWRRRRAPACCSTGAKINKGAN